MKRNISPGECWADSRLGIQTAGHFRGPLACVSHSSNLSHHPTWSTSTHSLAHHHHHHQRSPCRPCYSKPFPSIYTNVTVSFETCWSYSPFCRSFRNLSPKARIGVGAAFLAWGTIGLYISDNAEKKLGFEPTEKDREELDAVVPKITVVERNVKG